MHLQVHPTFKESKGNWSQLKILWMYLLLYIIFVFLTWLCALEICWSKDAAWRRPGPGWWRRWTSIPELLWRMGSYRHRLHSHWESGPLCHLWPVPSAHSQSWTGGRWGRRSSASGRFSGLPTGEKHRRGDKIWGCETEFNWAHLEFFTLLSMDKQGMFSKFPPDSYS